MSDSIRAEIKFGTDGWRGVIADNFTFKNVSIVAQAIADWVNQDLKPKAGRKAVAVGYDARFLSKEFAQVVACVLAKNNIPVILSDRMIPTPALSYGVVNLEGVCGIMITASHNPANFNGVKIKTAEGGGAGSNITNIVERNLTKNLVAAMDFKEAVAAKLITMHNFMDAYLKFMKRYINIEKVRKAKFKVIQDVMHGSGGTVMPDVLKGSQLRFSQLRSDYNPSFGGVKPEPIKDYVPGLLKAVKEQKADLGLILDGDADRIAAVAPGGEYIHPQKILGLLILHLARNRGRTGGVVKTICGTMMIDNIAKKLGLKLYETPVGFKYISDLMVNERIIAGGEEAGGMGVQDYIPERDGNLAGLLLLEMMVYQKKNIKQILEAMEKEFGKYYYERCDIKFGEGRCDLDSFKKTTQLVGKKVINVKDFDGVKLTCEDDSWLMLRPSGTEPLVRAYSEAKTPKRAKDLIKYGEQLLRQK